MTENEKKEYLFILNEYPYIAIGGWLIAIILLLQYRTIYPFVVVGLLLLFINIYLLIKFELNPVKELERELKFVNYLLWNIQWITGFYANKEVSRQKSEINRRVGLILLSLGVLGIIVVLGVLFGIFS